MVFTSVLVIVADAVLVGMRKIKALSGDVTAVALVLTVGATVVVVVVAKGAGAGVVAAAITGAVVWVLGAGANTKGFIAAMRASYSSGVSAVDEYDGVFLLDGGLFLLLVELDCT